ncbi:MAG: imidazole glycerol phosphate synthase subunit HisH [Eubacteriales bacterium]|nr:imidazole glycerol phosphate synthase subunit HisH [Eubacteriales bacterium]
MIAIIDYGVGNIYSLISSLHRTGAEVCFTGDPDEIARADRMVLPGVGAFGDAAESLRKTGLDKVVRKEALSGKPLLGICLGMQLLLEKSYEYGEHEGLGLIKGTIDPIEPLVPKGYKIPHIGWNALHFPKDKPKSPLFKDVPENSCVYFVHSYYANAKPESVLATTEYGAELTAAVSNGNVYGVQFHPEKSGEIGQRILKAFLEL